MNKSKTKNYSELFTSTLLETFQILKPVYLNEQNFKRVKGKFLRTDRETYMRSTTANILPHISPICSLDGSMFCDDYSSKPIFLIVGLDFKELWRCNLSEEVQEKIFTQVQLLFIYGSLALKINKPLVRDMIENNKVENDIQDELAEAERQEKEASQMSMESIFGKNSALLEILQEIIADPTLKSQLNLPEDFQSGNPQEMIAKLLNGDTLNNIMNILQTRLKEKMTEKGLTDKDIESETHKLSQNVLKKFGNNPMFKKMGLDKMLKKLTEDMMNATTQPTPFPIPTPNNDEVMENLKKILETTEQMIPQNPNPSQPLDLNNLPQGFQELMQKVQEQVQLQTKNEI